MEQTTTKKKIKWEMPHSFLVIGAILLVAQL